MPAEAALDFTNSRRVHKDRCVVLFQSPEFKFQFSFI
jgi:hypothetical protein